MSVEESQRLRNLKGPFSWLVNFALVAIPVSGIIFLLNIPQRLGWLFFPEQYLGLFLGFALCATFLGVPERSSGHHDQAPWYDVIAAALGLAIGLYLFVFYPQLTSSLGEIYLTRVVLGCLVVLLLVEACRRLVGWPLIIIVGVFLFYALFANHFPGQFYGRGWSVNRLATYLFLDTNGIFGFALKVSASTVLAFILFGEGLSAVGGAAFLSDFALTLMGRFRGGPAKIAIVSSSLFGNISGSAVANVVVDGTFTIPMMRRSGYPAPVAAAIEAVASTGGQIMPPVMGAAAFLIAEYLAIPYPQVALAALVPAILYYVTLFIQVDLLAARNGIRGLPRDQLPRLLPVMRKSAGFVVPLFVLVLLMFFMGRQAEESALIAVASALLVGVLTPSVKLGPRVLWQILANTGRGMLEIAAVTGLAGVVIGVLQLTGLGFTLTFTLLNVGQSSPLLLLVLTAVISIILGMGMPTTAVYILLAVLIAPGLSQLGIAPIAAHLFIFYFGMLSMITPPVCLASYAAASIGKTDPMRTGWEGMRLCAIAYIVPFLFVFSPSLLLIGHWYNVVVSVITAILGSILLGVSLVGYLFRRIGVVLRFFFFVASMGLLLPVVSHEKYFELTWLSNLLGLALGILLVVAEGMVKRRSARGLLTVSSDPVTTVATDPEGPHDEAR